MLSMTRRDRLEKTELAIYNANGKDKKYAYEHQHANVYTHACAHADAHKRLDNNTCMFKRKKKK